MQTNYQYTVIFTLTPFGISQTMEGCLMFLIMTMYQLTMGNEESLSTLYKKEMREAWNLQAHQYKLSTVTDNPYITFPQSSCALNKFIISYFKSKMKKKIPINAHLISLLHDNAGLGQISSWLQRKLVFRVVFEELFEILHEVKNKALLYLSPVKFQRSPNHIALDIFFSV